MRYVYGCKKGHEKEVEHRMQEIPEIICDECGGVMHKIPQPFSFYMNPFETLTDRMTDEYGAFRHRGRRGVQEFNKKRGEVI